MKEVLKDANFPRDAEGRTYHVGTKPGQVANRIITVGDSVRARRIAAHFDGGKPTFELQSQRNFLTLTGTYQGVPISVVAIGMGFPLVDFFIRETRAVVTGDMIVVRLGSCGSISHDAQLGTVVTPYESFGVFRNCDWWHPDDDQTKGEPYLITKALPCDRDVHDALLSSLVANRPAAKPDLFGGKQPVALGEVTNGSADSFYSSQGRQDPTFYDVNSDLIEKIKAKHPDAKTFEMETYLINHLARCANVVPKEKGGKGKIRVGAAQMIFADRSSSGFITPEEVEELEGWAGKSVCQALVGLEIENESILSIPTPSSPRTCSSKSTSSPPSKKRLSSHTSLNRFHLFDIGIILLLFSIYEAHWHLAGDDLPPCLSFTNRGQESSRWLIPGSRRTRTEMGEVSNVGNPNSETESQMEMEMKSKTQPWSKRSLILTAHPDDEVMFFAPLVWGLQKRGTQVRGVCVSVGNADGLGEMRSRELREAYETLGVPRERVLALDHPQLRDGMQEKWDAELLADIVQEEILKHDIDTIFTFDDQGVSGHPNHIALSKAVSLIPGRLSISNSPNIPRIYHLRTTPLSKKYLSLPYALVVRFSSIVKHGLLPRSCSNGRVILPFPSNSLHHQNKLTKDNAQREDPRRITLLSSPSEYLETLEAMKKHASQLVWFRRLYVVASSHMFVAVFERE